MVMWYCHIIFLSPHIVYYRSYSPTPRFREFSLSLSVCACPTAAANRAPLGNSGEFFLQRVYRYYRDRNELQLAKYKLYRFAT